MDRVLDRGDRSAERYCTGCPVPGDIIQNQNTDGRTQVGALNIWLTPHGFLKGAAANGGAKISGTRGKDKLVSFTAFGKYTVTAAINEQNLIETVETRIDGGFTGDTLIEGIYSGYKDFGGVKFPMHIVQRQGGYPILDITVARNAGCTSSLTSQVRRYACSHWRKQEDNIASWSRIF